MNTDLHIAGQWRSASSGKRFTVDNPATEDPIAEVADADVADAMTALDAAHTAQPSWAATAPRARGEILRRAFEILTDRADDVALLITSEMGKPIAESRAEVTYGAEFFRWFAEEAVRVGGTYRVAPGGEARLVTMKQPVGPSLLITPWNFPLAMATRKVGAAVAAGCTMILKPAEQTPLTSLLLAQVLAEAGLPPGVLNVIPAADPAPVSAALMRDARLRKISFTGSTEVGRLLMSQAAHNLLRVSMELGGNAPFLVFADADLDAAVDGAMVAKMRNGGESCVAANRFLVHRDVADEFATRLARRMASLTVGPGTDAGVDVGPLIDAAQRTKVAELVDDAVRTGSTILTGGQMVPGRGHFYRPTVLIGISPQARISQEEVFGPVAPIVTFDDDTQAIAAANDTQYGLVAYLYTRDLNRAITVSEALETGMVGVNRGIVSNPAGPFGGVKHSGFGREGGSEGIDEYLSTKYIAVQS
jgi:succinate-semialdehyde dehydrogenase/glutarate-semialdehyde dehydrogenase